MQDAQAVLQRIRDAATPVSLWDDRLADQRRLDAAVDLLLGRNPLGDGHGSGCAAGCGCLPGQAVPCGAALNVHVTLNGALGTTDEPTEWDELSPDELDEQLWFLDGRPEDPAGYELRAQDLEPDDVEPPHKTDTTWSWDLDDPYVWLPDSLSV